ncbi:hypothetical protein DJ526_09550 [Sulfolobus sp. A20-N-G8]|nr:hypothetical protein DJ526_09550 [Sulfolobus sp. A20-N-G8]
MEMKAISSIFSTIIVIVIKK